MSDQESSEVQEQSDSDEEVPVLQLCCLPLTDLHSLDPNSNEDFSTLLTVLANEDIEKAYAAVMRIRKLLSTGSNPPIQTVIEAGGVYILQKAMQHRDERIRHEAAWALTNILSGDSKSNTAKALKCGCISTLVHLMNQEKSWNVKQQSLWGFGNIAAQTTIWRDQILKAGGLTAILANLYEESHTYVKNVCWVVSNMMKAIPPPDPCYHLQAVPFILSHLSLENGFEMNSDLLWALSSITLQCGDSIQLNHRTCELLVGLMDHPATYVSLPALLTIQNILSSTNTYTNVFIDIGLLGKMNTLLNHSKHNLRREACGIVASLSAQSYSSAEQILLSGILPCITKLALEDHVSIRKHAICVLADFCKYSSPDFTLSLLNIGIARPLIESLDCKDREISAVAMDGLRGLLRNMKAVIRPEAIGGNSTNLMHINQ